MLADVASLARHTKALDKEVRGVGVGVLLPGAALHRQVSCGGADFKARPSVKHNVGSGLGWLGSCTGSCVGNRRWCYRGAPAPAQPCRQELRAGLAGAACLGPSAAPPPARTCRCAACGGRRRRRRRRCCSRAPPSAGRWPSPAPSDPSPRSRPSPEARRRLGLPLCCIGPPCGSAAL